MGDLEGQILLHSISLNPYDIESSDVEIVPCPKCEAIHVSVTSSVIVTANAPVEVTKSTTTVTPEGCNQCKSTNEDN